MAILNKAKAILRSKGKDKRQAASLPAPSSPEGQAGKPAHPFMSNSIYFHILSSTDANELLLKVTPI